MLEDHLVYRCIMCVFVGWGHVWGMPVKKHSPQESKKRANTYTGEYKLYSYIYIFIYIYIYIGQQDR